MADIESCAKRNAKLAAAPAKLAADHEMYRAVRPSTVETPKQTGRNQQSGQGSEISGAMCLVQGCGKDLKGHDLNEYRQRCNRANGQLCKAMCMDHYRQAARSVKGMKWRDGKPIRDQQLFVSRKMQVREGVTNGDI